jgi:hypothetical protein
MIFAYFCVLVHVRLAFDAFVISWLCSTFLQFVATGAKLACFLFFAFPKSLNVEHLKRLFATTLSCMLQISHPSLTFFCGSSFRVYALTSVTNFRVRFFVS